MTLHQATEPDSWSHCRHCGQAVAENLQLQHGNGAVLWTHVEVKSIYCAGQNHKGEFAEKSRMLWVCGRENHGGSS